MAEDGWTEELGWRVSLGAGIDYTKRVCIQIFMLLKRIRACRIPSLCHLLMLESR